MERCSHKHVARTVKTTFYFENGWEKDVEENDDCDFADYEQEIEYWIYQCQDCGKVLVEM